jgi:hypothetical protein
VQLVTSLTAVCATLAVTANPATMALQFLKEMYPPDAAFVSPLGQLCGTALEE